MALLEFGLLLVTLVILVWFYFKQSYSYWKNKKIPYMEPVFPYGNLDSLLPRGISIGLQSKKYFEEFKKRNLKYGGVYAVAAPMLVVNDLDIIKDILIKDFSHFSDRGIYNNPSSDKMSSALFTQGGHKWKTMRSKFTPTFTSGKIKAMFDAMSSNAKNMIGFLDGLENKEAVNIKYLAQGYTIDLIGSTVFGLECDSFKTPDTMFREMARKMLQVNFTLGANLCLAIYHPNLARKLGVYLIDKDVAKFFATVARDNVHYRESNNIRRPDLFQSLIDLKNLENAEESIGIDEVAAQTLSFFFAGFETSSSTIMFCLYELARNQEIQEKVREDVRKMVQKHDGEITYDGIKEMKYLGQVIDETLRMYPLVSTLTRVCTKNYQIHGTDDVIEKGTKILISAAGIHKDSDLWVNPHEFDPERFNDENKQNIHPCAYLPFGEGPKNCIGMRFGLLETKIGVATLLSNYRFHISPETKQPLEFEPQTFFLLTIEDIVLKVEKL
ncbi:unnamed protein product [Brassicogethes aeneus]|uniref:Cytochrome P450 n=1 Tax=Brassicogethes aeneus TaxID=1431903 RepID=A0A9P0AVK1_BRAAE|nr:unnamed protein product [Brassicogethes aeneus]